MVMDSVRDKKYVLIKFTTMIIDFKKVCNNLSEGHHFFST